MWSKNTGVAVCTWWSTQAGGESSRSFKRINISASSEQLRKIQTQEITDDSCLKEKGRKEVHFLSG